MNFPCFGSHQILVAELLRLQVFYSLPTRFSRGACGSIRAGLLAGINRPSDQLRAAGPDLQDRHRRDRCPKIQRLRARAACCSTPTGASTRAAPTRAAPAPHSLRPRGTRSWHVPRQRRTASEGSNGGHDVPPRPAQAAPAVACGLPGNRPARLGCDGNLCPPVLARCAAGAQSAGSAAVPAELAKCSDAIPKFYRAASRSSPARRLRRYPFLHFPRLHHRSRAT